MKKITQLTFAMMLALIIASCGNSSKDGKASLNDKKAELEKLKASKNKTDADIQKLQEELNKLDSNSADASKIKLVGVSAVKVEDFKHYIDLQGKVDAENISDMAPRGMPGQVKAVYVVQGQSVKKGQLLLKLDDAISRQGVVAARQQADGIQTQLNFKKNVYERRKKLWDQGIGTQVEVIAAKAEVEGLEAQLGGVREGVRSAQEQVNLSNVYSDVAGVADIVNIHVGETFSGNTQNGPQLRIVNTSKLKIVTNVPENYISRIRKGSVVEINIPDANKKINSTISMISQSIDPSLRGFIAEARIPADVNLKPNQTAIMKILDYSKSGAVVIPVNTVQTDESGKYVYVMEKQGNGKAMAKKKSVDIGEVYGNLVEIKTGLSGGEQLITEGYQNLYEGALIATESPL